MILRKKQFPRTWTKHLDHSDYVTLSKISVG